MEDHDLIIRIDERQAAMASDLKDILSQVKKTNGRVSVLENYQDKDETRAAQKIKQIDDHESRLKEIEELHLQGRGSWKTIKIISGICVGIGSLLAIVLEYLIKH